MNSPKERPAKCNFCKQPLFYRGDPRWEEEVTIDYGFKTHDLEFRCYAHHRCVKDMFTFEHDAIEINLAELDEVLSRLHNAMKGEASEDAPDPHPR
jgi:hypothetical protein